MARKITLAVAGEGTVELDTVKALLNDWLGFGDEDERGYPEPTKNSVEVLIPGSAEALTPGVQTVLDWVDYADVPYVLVTNDVDDRKVRRLIRNAHDLVEAKNVAAEMITQLEKAKGERYLVLLWGQEGDPFAETLLDLASASDIPVKDLTEGLDDIEYADDETEEEEEPPAKKTEQLLEEEEELLQDEEPEPLPHDRIDTPVVSEVEGAPRVETGQVVSVLETVYEHLYYADQANAARILQPVRRSPLTDLVLGLLTALRDQEPTEAPETEEEAGQEESTDEAPRRGRGRPRKDGTPAQPRTDEDQKVAYLRTDDGEYRKRGRGRPRRGEQIVYLTPTQINELGLEGDD